MFADLTALKTTSDQTKADLDRIKIVALEFPALVDLEKNGALPALGGDDLRKALGAISSKIESSASGKVKDALDGASVTPPPATSPKTAEELKKAAITVQNTPGKTLKEIEEAWDQYYAVKPKED